MFALLGVAVGAAYHVVSAFALVLAPLPWGLATAAAIVFFTLAVRMALLPLSYYAIRGQASQARLAPEIQALRQRRAEQVVAEQAVRPAADDGGPEQGVHHAQERQLQQQRREQQQELQLRG